MKLASKQKHYKWRNSLTVWRQSSSSHQIHSTYLQPWPYETHLATCLSGCNQNSKDIRRVTLWKCVRTIFCAVYYFNVLLLVTVTFFNSLEWLKKGKKIENLFSFEIFTAMKWSDFFWSVELVSKSKGEAIITTVLN